MYIRRKVFSVALDENGEERLFSTNEVIGGERMFSDLPTAIGRVALDGGQLKKLAAQNNMTLREYQNAVKGAADAKALKKLGITKDFVYNKVDVATGAAVNQKPLKMTKAQIAKFEKEQAAKKGYAKYNVSNAPRNVGTSARGKQAVETFQKYGDRIAKVERRLDAKKWAKRGGIGLAAGAAAGAAGYGAYRALKKNND